MCNDDHKWYVVQTYSGYENKVKVNLEKIILNREIGDLISEIFIPMEDTIEVKDGKKKTVKRKILPGYVLIKMHMDDHTWSVVRNTRGVTSFVGPGSKPSPLSQKDLAFMGVKQVIPVGFNLEDTVKIISGPFQSSIGQIKNINMTKQTVVVSLSVFGRETPVELDFTQIQPI